MTKIIEERELSDRSIAYDLVIYTDPEPPDYGSHEEIVRFACIDEDHAENLFICLDLTTTDF